MASYLVCFYLLFCFSLATWFFLLPCSVLVTLHVSLSSILPVALMYSIV